MAFDDVDLGLHDVLAQLVGRDAVGQHTAGRAFFSNTTGVALLG